MTDTFISYRRDPSGSLAQLVQEKLKNSHKLDAYVDTTRADSAKVQFPERLMQAIEDAPVFICLLGLGTLDSEWVLKEIRRAYELQKPCIPVFQEKYIPYSGDDPAVVYLLSHDGVHVFDVKSVHMDYSVSQIADILRKTWVVPTPSVVPTPKPTPRSDFDIHDAIDRYDAAVDAKKWVDAHQILDDIRVSGQTAPGFRLDKEWDKITGIITKIETDAARDKAYASVERRAVRLPVPELKEALADFWQTYPDHDPRYLVKPRPHVWIKIPAGKVTLEDGGYIDKPTTFDVPAFEIGKYPVTVAQYDSFIQDGGYQNPKWWDGLALRVESPRNLPDFSRPDHPRVYVSWYESVAYCRWLSVQTGKNVRLLTEQEWQRAAQGDDNRVYPWGDEWDGAQCNNSQNHDGTTPTTLYEGKDKGDSPYGVVDMAGNVWEWCVTDYRTGSADLSGDAPRVLRGGSWGNGIIDYFRAACRYRNYPSSTNYDGGFRLARSQ